MDAEMGQAVHPHVVWPCSHLLVAQQSFPDIPETYSRLFQIQGRTSPLYKFGMERFKQY